MLKMVVQTQSKKKFLLPIYFRNISEDFQHFERISDRRRNLADSFLGNYLDSDFSMGVRGEAKGILPPPPHPLSRFVMGEHGPLPLCRRSASLTS